MIGNVMKVSHSKEKGHKESSNPWVLRRGAYDLCSFSCMTNIPGNKWIKL